jgi:hypothetical protein
MLNFEKYINIPSFTPQPVKKQGKAYGNMKYFHIQAEFD